MERNIITLKTRRNAENACVNWMWQLGFRKTFVAKDQMSLNTNSLPTFFLSVGHHDGGEEDVGADLHPNRVEDSRRHLAGVPAQRETRP